jgi:preprotein translocase subunit SecB
VRPSPLQLEGYLVTELSFKAQLGFEYDRENPQTTVQPAELTVDVRLAKHQEEQLRRSCELTVELADPTGSKFPYVFRTAFTGFFCISEHYPAEQVDLMFATNAPALLYSAARELLATVTGRGPYPSITLPSVTFLPLPSEPTKSDMAGARSDKSAQNTLRTRKTSKAPTKNKMKPVRIRSRK